MPEVFYADGIAIPLTFAKERIVAEAEGKIKVVPADLPRDKDKCSPMFVVHLYFCDVAHHELARIRRMCEYRACYNPSFLGAISSWG